MKRRHFLTAATAGTIATAATNAQQSNKVLSQQSSGRLAKANPFKVVVPQTKLDQIRRRVQSANLPTPMGDGGWETGVDDRYLRTLQNDWLNQFDWRTVERKLNQHPQYFAQVDGLTLHFYHVPGEGTNPKPLLLVHGWPYSAFSFIDLIEPLTTPTRFGGSAQDAFTVVIPSLPGYGFSAKPKQPIGPGQTAQLYHKLMTEVLGYRRFGLQGGDHGCVVTAYLAHQFPDAVTGLHLNLVPTIPVPPSEQTAVIKAWQAEVAMFQAKEFNYFGVQTQKPASLAYAMVDSPVGVLAWFLDKFWSWFDHDLGNLDKAIGRDRILTETMIYLTTSTIESSFWFYRAQRAEPFHPGTKIMTPTGLYLAHKEFPIGRPPRSVAEQSYNLVRYSEIPKGGHFPFWETPDLFIQDVRSFFRSIT